MDPAGLIDWMTMEMQTNSHQPHDIHAFNHEMSLPLALPLQQQPQPQPQPQPLSQSQPALESDPLQLCVSNFHFLRLIESLAETVESGVRDQHSESTVNELVAQFEKCQQILNSLAGPSETMSANSQKQKLEDNERQLNHRRELMAKYKDTVQNYIQSS